MAQVGRPCHFITPATTKDNIVEDVCEEISGLTISTQPEEIGVATFTSEAGKCDVVPYDAETSSFVKGSAAYQDLKEYFQRPRLIATGSVPTTRTRFWSSGVDVPTVFNSWFPNGLTRLTGVSGVRFSIKVALTVSATPFQQGLIAMSWQYDTYPDDIEIFPRSISSALVTQLPHVRLDLAENTMVELDIPFLYRLDYFELADNGNALGCLALNTLMAYRTLTNAAPPTYKVYVSLHDLELIGSMPQNLTYVVPQSGLVEYQSGVTGSRTKHTQSSGNQITKEARSTGTISGLLGTTASAIGTISKAVMPFAPQLSVIGGTTDWFLRSASKVASAFGYSKPVVEKESNKVWRHDYAGEGQIDLPNPGYVVSPFQSNKVRVDSTLAASDVDEMSMGFVLSKYAQVFVGDMTTNDTTGARLYAAGVGPYSFWFRTNSNRPGGNLPVPVASPLTANAIAPTPLLFFGNMFRYWRGGVKFRFTFAKTKFHAGRVIVSFVPKTADENTLQPSTTNIPALEVASGLPQPFNYCEIFDLRDSSTFEFTCPFISPYLWLNVNGIVGGITMTVLDPLIANGEASTTIDYMVEVCGAEDFELASPSNPTLSPTAGYGVVFYQSGLAGIEPGEPNITEYTVGEKFNSLKQLMMIPNYIAGDVTTATTSYTTLTPFFFRPRWDMFTPMPNGATAYWGFTRSGSVASCYAFYQGSTAYHVYSDYSGPYSTLQIVNAPNDGNGGTAGFSDPREKNIAPTGTVRVRTQQGVMHATLPLYSKVARMPYGSYVYFYSTRNFGGLGTQVNNSSPLSNVQYNLMYRNNSGSTNRVYVGRAAGDDARCACYIGVPPVVIFPSTLAGSPDAGELS